MGATGASRASAAMGATGCDGREQRRRPVATAITSENMACNQVIVHTEHRTHLGVSPEVCFLLDQATSLHFLIGFDCEPGKLIMSE